MCRRGGVPSLLDVLLCTLQRAKARTAALRVIECNDGGAGGVGAEGAAAAAAAAAAGYTSDASAASDASDLSALSALSTTPPRVGGTGSSGADFMHAAAAAGFVHSSSAVGGAGGSGGGGGGGSSRRSRTKKGRRRRKSARKEEAAAAQAARVASAAAAVASRSLHAAEKALLHIALNGLTACVHSARGAGAGGVEERLKEPNSPLARILRLLFENAHELEGEIFPMSAMVMCEVLNATPSSVSIVHSSGLAAVVLRVLQEGRIRPERESIGVLPQIISVLCLTPPGLRSVVATRPFRSLFALFRSPAFTPPLSTCLNGDVPATVGANCDELLRHHTGLRTPFVQAAVASLKAILASRPPAPPGAPPQCLFPPAAAAAAARPEGGAFWPACEESGAATARRNLHNLAVGQTVGMLTLVLESAEVAAEFVSAGGVGPLFELYATTLPPEEAYLLFEGCPQSKPVSSVLVALRQFICMSFFGGKDAQNNHGFHPPKYFSGNVIVGVRLFGSEQARRAAASSGSAPLRGGRPPRQQSRRARGDARRTTTPWRTRPTA